MKRTELSLSEYTKTTKPHKCWGCGNEIPPGDKVFTSTVKENTFDWPCYWCDVCVAYIGVHRESKQMNEGIGFRQIIKDDPIGWKDIKNKILST